MCLRPGYTLVELSVVLLLISLIFFISMPRLGDFLFQTDLKDAARSLKSVVYFLRSKSIVTHTPTVLHLDLDRGLYWGDILEREEVRPGLGKARPVLVPPKGLPDGIRFLDAANINTSKRKFGVLTSVFNPKGALEETVIHLSDKRSNIMTIIVNAFTGTFSIYDEYVDVEYGK
ncbi:MAG: prepilin-type N-terminal cleavage/methylation domain-containing protein [Thermodesulfobacteriota bacterium]